MFTTLLYHMSHFSHPFNLNDMKIFASILAVVILNTYYINAQSVKTNPRRGTDSIMIKAQKLKQLYKLSMSSSAGFRDNYKQQFFDQFPSTYHQLNELYGYDYGTNTAAPLESLYHEHIVGLFNILNE